MALLEVEGLSKHFGGLQAVSNLDLEVREGEILGLIGPNGAGKTTVFNLVAGGMSPSSGKITHRGKDITGIKPQGAAARGLVRTFQIGGVFRSLSVLDNVIVGCQLLVPPRIWGDLIGLPSARRQGKKVVDAGMQILDLVGLSEMASVPARELTPGMERRLALAIALGCDPQLLMLDEPAAGLNPEEVQGLMKLLRELRQRNVTILLIEHVMTLVMGLCDRVVVINLGSKIAEGLPSEIRNNKAVLEAYLGNEHAAL